MDSVHALLIGTEGNSKLAQKWIITDEATVAPCAVHTCVRDSIRPLFDETVFFISASICFCYRILLAINHYLI